MRHIPLKKHETEKELTTATLLKIALDTPPDGGFTTSDMRSRLKIMDKIDSLNCETTVLELEDAEHATVLTAFNKVKWGRMDKFIVDLEDSLK